MAKNIIFVGNADVERAIEAERQRLMKLQHGSHVTKSTAIRSLLCRPVLADATA